jgi:hypothetical protein
VAYWIFETCVKYVRIRSEVGGFVCQGRHVTTNVLCYLHISRMSLLYNTTHAYIGETDNGRQSSVAVIWDNNRDRIRRVEERKVRGRLMQSQAIVISISAQMVTHLRPFFMNSGTFVFQIQSFSIWKQ